MLNENPRAKLAIDGQRLVENVDLAYQLLEDELGAILNSKDSILRKLGAVLNTGLVSTIIQLPLGVKHAPDMFLEVDPRSRRVFCRSPKNPRLQAAANKAIGGIK